MIEPVLTPAGLFDLTGRIAIVTGASSGLGRRFTEVLHAAGASVIAVARRADRLDDLALNHDRVIPLTADLSIAAELETVVPTALDRFGRIDILINNAGFGHPSPAVDEPLSDFRHVLEVNLVSAFHLSRLAAVPMLAAEGGTIINVSSILGLGAAWPIPDASYSSSKGALISLTRDLACQWARGGIRVNALAPGFFPTEASASMVDDESSQRYIRRNCPMHRMGLPHELDGAVLFLSSSASTYMTGQVLTVDGGWTAH